MGKNNDWREALDRARELAETRFLHFGMGAESGRCHGCRCFVSASSELLAAIEIAATAMRDELDVECGKSKRLLQMLKDKDAQLGGYYEKREELEKERDLARREARLNVVAYAVATKNLRNALDRLERLRDPITEEEHTAMIRAYDRQFKMMDRLPAAVSEFLRLRLWGEAR